MSNSLLIRTCFRLAGKVMLAALLLLAYAMSALLPSASAARDAELGVAIANPSFEESLGTTFTGWSQTFGSGGIVISREQAFDALQSVKLTDTSTAASIGLESNKVSVIAGGTYEAAVHVYVLQGSAFLYIRYFDSSGTLLSSASKAVSSPVQQWVPLRVRAAAPSGATQASILLYGTTSGTHTAYYDNVSLTRVLQNSGFEEGSPGTTIPGWEQTFPSPGISVVNTTAYSGAQSLKIADSLNTDSAGLETLTLPAVAGQRFVGRAYANVVSGTVSLQVRFYDASGNYISNGSISSGPTSGWKLLQTSAVAPTGAKTVRVLLYSSINAVSTAYFDDVELVGAYRNMGPQIYTVSVRSIGITKDSQNRPLVLAGLSGNPSKMVTVDPDLETVLQSYTLTGNVNPSSMATASDGAVMIGGAYKGMYRFVPSTGSLTSVSAFSTETWTYGLKPGGSGGAIFGGTYPNNKLFKYTPTSGVTQIIGPVDGESYARSVAYDSGQNQVFVGTGSHAHLYSVNLSTNTRSANLLPSSYSGEQFVDLLQIAGNKLIARVTPSFNGLVFDKNTMVLEDTIPKIDSGVITPKSPNENAVYYTVGGVLTKYDLTAKTAASIVNMGENFVAGADFVQLSDPNYPGYTLIGFSQSGSLMKYNLQTGSFRKVTLNLLDQPVEIKTIVGGPDGKVYTGGFLTGDLGVYDPAAGGVIQYDDLNQMEGATQYNGKLYFGTYSSAQVYEYDPYQPYVMGTNPKRLATLSITYEQDRPFALAGAGTHNKLFVGTVAKYGKLPGALTEFNLSNGTFTVHKNIVANQSVISLAYKDGKIYGGTSVWGGLGIDPTETAAKLFVWDVATGQKTSEIVPVAGKKAITSLTVGPDGNIWGFAEGTLFIYSPSTGSVTYSSAKFSYTFTSTKWSDIDMQLGKDGHFYGTSQTAQQFFKLDSSSKAITVLQQGNGIVHLGQDTSGRFYFARDEHHLWVYDDPSLTGQ